MDPRKRPLSPHLQIYKPQLTSVLSIFHRATGIVVAFGMMALAAFVISLWYGEEIFLGVTNLLHSFVGGFLFIGFVACFFYHFFNGIRHLFWDVGLGFSLPVVYKSGYAVIIASLLSLALYVFLFLTTAPMPA